LILKYKLGRSDSCSLIIEDESISPVHVVFMDYGDYLKIEDTSKNGTFVVRKGSKRKLSKHTVEILKSDDLLYFGFYDFPFPVFTILAQIKELRSPVGSQRVRCAVHGIIYFEGTECPICKKQKKVKIDNKKLAKDLIDIQNQ
jgi:pSer/pThr/pTyr-binding forkhead associated (FHA) protein